MSIYKHITLLLMLAGATSGIAQQRYDLNNFYGIRSEGPIPTDLRKSLSELYSEDKQRVRDYNDGKLANRDRVLEVSYHINRLMSNGRISYGDLTPVWSNALPTHCSKTIMNCVANCGSIR